MIDLCYCKRMNLNVYDKAVEIINKNGWKAKHKF